MCFASLSVSGLGVGDVRGTCEVVVLQVSDAVVQVPLFRMQFSTRTYHDS